MASEIFDIQSAAFAKFADALKKLSAKLRCSSRMTIDTSDPNATTFPEQDHACIEIKLGRRWVLLKMPNGSVFFPTTGERDRVLSALKAAIATPQ